MVSSSNAPSFGHHSSASSVRSISSTGTVSNYPRVEDVEEVTVEGVTHSETVLEAKRWRTAAFAQKLLTLLRDDLHIKSWDSVDLKPSHIELFKVAGSLTNAVYFISAPRAAEPVPRKVLLRIYGPSSSVLVSRPKELYMLNNLSSIYKIGPRVFGTFANGRVEEYFESHTLKPGDLRDPEISKWIGRRMSELHGVDIGEVMMPDDGWEDPQSIATDRNWKSWTPVAKEVLIALDKLHVTVDHQWHNFIRNFDMPRLEKEWHAYRTWLTAYEAKYQASERVFAHNDAQYGNLLRLEHPLPNRPSHSQIIVVDFEYASPNPAAFDIANHFHEWTTDYTSSESPWLLNLSRYPTLEQRQAFYHAYISPLPAAPSTGNLLSSSSWNISAANNPQVMKQLEDMDGLVRAWSPASHGMWAIWAIIQARDDITVLGDVGPEFNYLGYSLGRVAGFRREIAELGILV